MSVIGNEPRSFAEVNERLEQIAEEVKDKELSLEKSLDLYEEAVRLSNSALELVHKPDLSPDEAATLKAVREGKDEQGAHTTSDDGHENMSDATGQDEETISSGGTSIESISDTDVTDGDASDTDTANGDSYDSGATDESEPYDEIGD